MLNYNHLLLNDLFLSLWASLWYNKQHWTTLRPRPPPPNNDQLPPFPPAPSVSYQGSVPVALIDLQERLP